MALQHILCENEYSDLGGRTALEWDVVDFVGEFMSQLIHNPQVIRYRHVSKSKNLGGQVVMRRAAAARRRHLIHQYLEGAAAPLHPPSDMPEYDMCH